jgi:hypothetical protein
MVSHFNGIVLCHRAINYDLALPPVALAPHISLFIDQFLVSFLSPGQNMSRLLKKLCGGRVIGEVFAPKTVCVRVRAQMWLSLLWIKCCLPHKD